MTIAPPASAGRPRFYYVKEVATELRRTEASIRWMLHVGQLKGGKIGGRTVISAEEVDRIVAEAFAA